MEKRSLCVLEIHWSGFVSAPFLIERFDFSCCSPDVLVPNAKQKSHALTCFIFLFQTIYYAMDQQGVLTNKTAYPGSSDEQNGISREF